MKTLVLRLEESVQPSGVGFAVEDRRILARIGMWSGILLLANIAMLIGIHAWFREGLAVLGDAFAAAAYVTGFVVFLTTGSIKRFAQIGVWASVISVIFTHAVLGGFVWSGGFVLWGIVNILVTALWLDRSTTYWLAGIWAVASVVLAAGESTLQSMREAPDTTLAVLTAVLLFLTTLSLVVPAILALTKRIFDEQARTRSLILNILPESIADRLKDKSAVIADRYQECTVLFTDLVGFTRHSLTIEPEQLVAELNTVFTAFDHIVTNSGGEKIKTIGDGYMAAFNTPKPLDGHVGIGCDVALEMIETVRELAPDVNTDLNVRIGIATGPVVAGVIGDSKFSFDMWSDTVNLASRLEGAAAPGTTLVSDEVVQAAGNTHTFKQVGTIDLKGRPPTPAHQLMGRI